MTYLFFFGAIAVSMLTIFKIVPSVGRARFVGEITEIRDDAADAVIGGRLPPIPEVLEFIEGAEVLAAHPEQVSFSRLAAIHFAQLKHGSLEHAPRSYADLIPAQRKLMHQLDKRCVDAIARRIQHGSVFAVPLAIAVPVFRRLPVGAKVAVGGARTPRPIQLAEEYQNGVISVPIGPGPHVANFA